MTIYSFDVLPIHERPRNLETFTGWLRRLAMMNFLPSVNALISLGFPSQNRRVARQQADFPPLAIEDVARATYCAVTDVRATTFYQLGSKFARSPHPQALSRFLGGTIASHLRYCPECVAETGYYRLTWRFITLSGCHVHRCELLNQCGHCKAKIPVFCAPFAVDRCPKCRAWISDCTAPELSNDGLEQVYLQTQELSYLLTPQGWEESAADIVVLLGAAFTRLRLIRLQTVAEVSQQLGVTTSIIEGIERGNVRGRGASFRDYLAYANYLDTTVVQLMRSVVIPSNEAVGSFAFAVPEVVRSEIRQHRGEVLLQAVQEAVQLLEEAGNIITQEAIGAAIGMTPQGLKKYPVVAAYLRQHTSSQTIQRRQNRQADEAQLLQQAHDVVAKLQARGQTVSQRALARELNMAWSTLREYSTIRSWLKTLGK